jgi:hypothetical protein
MGTTVGHMIGFVKGEKTWVPPAAVPFAVAIGAQPVDDTLETEGIDPIPKEPPPSVQMTAEDRKKKAFAAFEMLLLRNNRGDFTASGMPHVKKLSDVVGFDVAPGERDELWIAYNTMKQQPSDA